MVDWWWELIMMPRSKMTSAGIGFRENSYVVGGLRSSRSSSGNVSAGVASLTVVFKRSRMRVDSTRIPH